MTIQLLGLTGFSLFESASIGVVLIIALLGLAYAVWLRKSILGIELPGGKMEEVWSGIKEGAEA